MFLIKIFFSCFSIIRTSHSALERRTHFRTLFRTHFRTFIRTLQNALSFSRSQTTIFFSPFKFKAAANSQANHQHGLHYVEKARRNRARGGKDLFLVRKFSFFDCLSRINANFIFDHFLSTDHHPFHKTEIQPTKFKGATKKKLTRKSTQSRTNQTRRSLRSPAPT